MVLFPLIPGFLKGVGFVTWWDPLEGTTPPRIRALRASALWDQPVCSSPSRDVGQLTAVESSAFSRSLLAPQGPRFSGWVLLIPGYLWEVKPHGPQADTASSSSLVIDGALIHFIILNTGEFCLPFFLCTVFGVLGFWFVFLVFFSEYDAPGTYIKLFWSGFVYSNLDD